MRPFIMLLLLGGLLLGLAHPAEAWPGSPPDDGRAARSRCRVSREAGAGAACAPGVRLTGRISGGDLLLQWEGSAAPAFEIYYSSAPFAGYVPIDRADTTFYREKLAHLDSTVINDFYQVQETAGGQVSNRLGVFTFELHG